MASMYQDIIASQKEMQQQQNTDQNQTSMPSVSTLMVPNPYNKYKYVDNDNNRAEEDPLCGKS